MSKRNNPFANDVRDAIQELRDEQGGRINGGVEAVYERARQKRGPADVEALADQALWGQVRAADDVLKHQAKSSQASLFTGDPEAIDGWFAGGDGGRVFVADANFDDWLARMSLQQDHVAEASAALSRTIADFHRLSPYLREQRMTTKQAVAAWQRDHPDAVSAD